MIYRFDNFEIDTQNYRLIRYGEVIEVEPKVFDLLSYLLVNRDRLVTRNELFENIWSGQIVSEASLDNQIKTVRKIVGDSGQIQSVIKTVRGRGYRFIAPTEEVAGHIVDDLESKGMILDLPDKPSIAVLPLVNMSDDPEQEYFSDGITEDITTALTYFSGLFVIARNSSFNYKNQSIDAR
jgi:DNA-binding winged helix-turn-helix (wHTH) protein